MLTVLYLTFYPGNTKNNLKKMSEYVFLVAVLGTRNTTRKFTFAEITIRKRGVLNSQHTVNSQMI